MFLAGQEEGGQIRNGNTPGCLHGGSGRLHHGQRRVALQVDEEVPVRALVVHRHAGRPDHHAVDDRAAGLSQRHSRTQGRPGFGADQGQHLRVRLGDSECALRHLFRADRRGADGGDFGRAGGLCGHDRAVGVQRVRPIQGRARPGLAGGADDSSRRGCHADRRGLCLRVSGATGS